MVEVANMKNFTPLALHNAVAMVDRCLMVRVFSRAMVQLLGVSAMVITSRYVPPDYPLFPWAVPLCLHAVVFEDCQGPSLHPLFLWAVPFCLHAVVLEDCQGPSRSAVASIAF